MEKILVVDDDPSILKVIKMRLEAEGYEVTTSLQAETALDLVKDEIFPHELADEFGHNSQVNVTEVDGDHFLGRRFYPFRFGKAGCAGRRREGQEQAKGRRKSEKFFHFSNMSSS